MWLKAAVLALVPVVEARTGYGVSDVPVHWHAEPHPLHIGGFTDVEGVHFYPHRADATPDIGLSVSRLCVVLHGRRCTGTAG